MTAILAASPAATFNSGLRELARIEARRFARHPLFLTGAAVLMVTAISGADDASPDLLGASVAPAFLLGILGLVVAARLTRSITAAGEAATTTPLPATTRTAALCLACLVPTAAAAVWLIPVFLGAAIWPPDPRAWWFGTVPSIDVIAIVGGGVLGALGGSLLGVVVGRWLHFRGATLVAMVVLLAVMLLVNIPLAPLSLLGPWVEWHSGTLSSGTAVLHGGSPLWYAGYQLCLCGIAVVAALLRDAPRRRPLLRVGAILVALAALTCILAITTGDTQPRTSPPISAGTG
jgi:hypothetical protein